MKKTILLAPLLFAFLTVSPAWAEEAHHPGTAPSPEMIQLDQEKIDAPIQRMQETRQKMKEAGSTAERKKLMHEHMQHMQEGMGMMEMMGKMDVMRAESEMEQMPMAGRMAMMEKQMAMMQEMMKGMMMQQEMMLQE